MSSKQDRDSDRSFPSSANLKRIGAHTPENFVRQGKAIIGALEQEMLAFFGELGPELRILDFGCGSGRVAIPFMKKYPSQLTCADVDRTAIAFMREHYGERCKSEVTLYEPPLPFDDGAFDCIYSVSVWTHIPPDLQIPWLREMHRISSAKPLLLLTTGGLSTLAAKQAKGRGPGITPEALKQERFFYQENKRATNNDELYPGVTGSYGVVYQTPDVVRERWSAVFDILAVKEGRVGKQDLVVMTKQGVAHPLQS